MAEEIRHLMAMPRPFDGFSNTPSAFPRPASSTWSAIAKACRSSFKMPTRHFLRFAHQYSLFANRPVSLRIYPHRIIVVAEGQAICQHQRVFARSHDRQSRTIYDWRHYLAVVQRKPGALRNVAPLAQMPPSFRSLQQHLLKRPGGDREMVEILSLVLQQDGAGRAHSRRTRSQGRRADQDPHPHLLHRLINGAPLSTPTIPAPAAYTLTTEPEANVERYDTLRRAREARHAS